MIKTSGYRISPTEIEEVLYGTKLLGEVAAFGVPHPSLGQCIVVVVTPKPATTIDEKMLLSVCRDHRPGFLVPARLEVRDGPLPSNPNPNRPVAEPSRNNAIATTAIRAVNGRAPYGTAWPTVCICADNSRACRDIHNTCQLIMATAASNTPALNHS